MAFGYPVVLDLTDVPVLMVGGGQIASRKVAGLLAAGARVTVVAPMVLPALSVQVHDVREREYSPADLEGHRLVMTATDDPVVNAAVGRDATAAGVWVNSADDPDNCSFILPAVARRGPVVVAVGTDGSSPALARYLRDRIADELLTPEVESAAIELARQRAEFHARGISTETIDWTDRLRTALLSPEER
jgi:siroheme synthase-like protein